MSEVTAEQLRQERHVPLPKNPEEWPLIPKLELLAEYADRTDDARGAGLGQRTVQRDVREAIKLLRLLADHPLTLAALQAGAEEREPDYEATARIVARRAGFSFDEWADTPSGADYQGGWILAARELVDAAIADAVVLVPRSK